MIVEKGISILLEVRCPEVFHPRAAAQTVERFRQVRSRVTLQCHRCLADGKSLIDLLLLPVERGDTVLIQIEGPDALAAADVVKEAFADAGRLKRSYTGEIHGAGQVDSIMNMFKPLDAAVCAPPDGEEGRPAVPFFSRGSCRGEVDGLQPLICDALNAFGSGIVLTNTAGCIVYVNSAFLKLLGLSEPSLVMGMFIDELLEGAAQTCPTGHEFEFTRADGSPVTLESIVYPVRSVAGAWEGSMIFFTDPTFRKVRERQTHFYEQRLQALSRRMVRIGERERRAIAGQIHDTAVQTLVIACMKMGMLEEKLQQGSEKPFAEALGEIRGLVEESMNKCRLIMSDLTPSELLCDGLHTGLVQLAASIEKQYGVHTRITIQCSEKMFAPEIAKEIHHAARELIINAVKHAGECAIGIRVEVEPAGMAMLCVSDDGAGFDTNAIQPREKNEFSGFGLSALRERMAHLHGRLEVDSSPGQGTCVTLWIPCTGL